METASTDEALKLITALVCTRNRGTQVINTIQSILANTHPHFELIVIDQSAENETELAVSPFLSDPRLRYLRSSTQGVSRARNLGMAEAHGAIVVMTDDDCVTPVNWLATIGAIFENNPTVAVAFCNVTPEPCNSHLGFIPAYQRRGSKLLVTSFDKCDARGIGAGIAVCRGMVLAIGGFDEILGPGAMFPSCEDGDIAVRALLGGYGVYETDAVAVRHAGFRTWEEGKLLSRRDWTGIGAAYSKPLKCGYWRFAVVPLYELFRFALWPPFRDICSGHRPGGLGRIVAFFQGFFRGLCMSVDPKTLLFRPSGNV